MSKLGQEVTTHWTGDTESLAQIPPPPQGSYGYVGKYRAALWCLPPLAGTPEVTVAGGPPMACVPLHHWAGDLIRRETQSCPRVRALTPAGDRLIEQLMAELCGNRDQDGLHPRRRNGRGAVRSRVCQPGAVEAVYEG